MEEPLLAANLVDPCYRAVDYERIARARQPLSGSEVRAALRDNRLRGTLEEVEREFSAVLGSLEPEARGVFVVYRAVTGFYPTTQLGRRLADRHPESTVSGEQGSAFRLRLHLRAEQALQPAGGARKRALHDARGRQG